MSLVTEYLNEKLLAKNIDFGDRNKLEYDFDEIIKREKFMDLLRNNLKKEDEKWLQNIKIAQTERRSLPIQ